MQIAFLAKVSVSTVDRVINQRGSVAADKLCRVVDAAKELGLERILPQPWMSTRRIEFITPRNPTPFWSMLSDAMVRRGNQLPKHYVLQRTRLPQSDLAAWKRAIENPVGTRHALIIAADMDDGIVPSLEMCQRRGEIVVSLTSEIEEFNPDGHSGIDNRAAGRTAGLLMRAMTRGQEGMLLVLPPHGRRAEHRQRVEGFLEAIGTALHVAVEPTNENPRRMIEIVNHYLKSTRLLGIYDSGYDSVEIASLLRETAPRPRWIAHECSPLHAMCLREGLLDFALDQSPDAQARCALEHVLSRERTAGRIALTLPPSSPELRIICRENIPAAAS